MGIVVRWRRRHDDVVRSGDSGTSMIEVFTAMILMTICGAIFTGAIVSLFNAANQAQAITSSSRENNQAYQTLDRTVRYAAAISQPGKSSTGGTGDWYVELRNTTDGTERCVQLRVDIAAGQLQRRTWKASDLSTLTSWLPLASGITNGSAAAGPFTQPFYRIPIAGTAEASAYPGASAAPPTLRHQILRFNLSAKASTPKQPGPSTSSFTLTALNSPATTTGSVCQQVGRP